MSTTQETDAIYQVYISDQNAEPPQLLHRAIASVQQCFSAYRYVRHNGDSLRTFIEQNFDREVVAAYDKLRPYSYKADLGRYCLLCQNGGWYADVSIMMRSHVAAISSDVDLIYFSILAMALCPGAVSLMFQPHCSMRDHARPHCKPPSSQLFVIADRSITEPPSTAPPGPRYCARRSPANRAASAM